MDGYRHRDTNSPRDHPTEFYRIEQNGDGTVDVILKPEAEIINRKGQSVLEKTVIIVEGVIPFEGMEEDIRRRYDAWCESGKRIHF